jgi:hypothetical protein
MYTGNITHGHFEVDKEATTEDVQKWLAERGMVAVPVGHLQSINNYLATSIEQAEAARDWIADTIKAAQEPGDD